MNECARRVCGSRYFKNSLEKLLNLSSSTHDICYLTTTMCKRTRIIASHYWWHCCNVGTVGGMPVRGGHLDSDNQAWLPYGCKKEWKKWQWNILILSWKSQVISFSEFCESLVFWIFINKNCQNLMVSFKVDRYWSCIKRYV